MRIFRLVVSCLFMAGCDPKPTPKYRGCPVIGERINPGFLVKKIEIKDYLLRLRKKYKEAQTARSQNTITEDELNRIAKSLDDDSAEILKTYKTGDCLWDYDNHAWNSFSGQSGLVLLRDYIVVWHRPGAIQ